MWHRKKRKLKRSYYSSISRRFSFLVMETIAECGCMDSLEVAEVNPILDHKNNSAEFAAEIVASSLGLRIL